MKKAIKVIICCAIAMAIMIPLCAYGADTPQLNSISFNNASIDSEFSPSKNEYTVTLDNPSETPTLKDYEVNGDAEILVTYDMDASKHQSGIIVTLEYDSGTSKYTFSYANAEQKAISSNNNLASLACQLGEVYPSINDKDTSYKLYIPSDMTEIKLTAITQDTSAFCDIPSVITLKPSQEPTINITVTASDTSTKIYTLKVKRLAKSASEVETEMKSDDFSSLVEDELFYKQPEFIIIILCSIAGIMILLILISIAKRITIKVSDDDEYDFFIKDEQEESCKE